MIELGAGYSRKPPHCSRRSRQVADRCCSSRSTSRPLHCRTPPSAWWRPTPPWRCWHSSQTSRTTSTRCPAPRASACRLPRQHHREPAACAAGRVPARLRAALAPIDCLLLGADLVKDPGRLVAAYDDAAGTTAAFNKNMLAVLARELDADIDLNDLQHVAVWNAARSASFKIFRTVALPILSLVEMVRVDWPCP